MENKKKVRIISKLNKEIEVEQGTNLLETLNRKAIFLRTDCGGRGRCGKCVVKSMEPDGQYKELLACQESVEEDIAIEIPPTSIASSYVMTKAPLIFPENFTSTTGEASDRSRLNVAVDLGTTTVAIYLCDVVTRKVVASTAVKNPQAAYGDDVITRISAIANKPELLEVLQGLVVGAIGWGIESLLKGVKEEKTEISDVVVVGNPTMIHILVGEDPQPLGKAPYHPFFMKEKH